MAHPYSHATLNKNREALSVAMNSSTYCKRKKQETHEKLMAVSLPGGGQLGWETSLYILYKVPFEF